MLTILLEWALVLISAAATMVSLVHLIESWRAARVASSTNHVPIRLLVAHISRRGAILRLLFAITLLATGLLLVGVPDQDMDYPGLINAFTVFLAGGAVLVLLFGMADIRDRHKVTELLERT